mgnify:CR=1 FL=1
MEFDKLLVTGVERGASDLHLKAERAGRSSGSTAAWCPRGTSA